MVTTRQRGVVVQEVPEGAKMFLQDILELEEPLKTHRLKEWLEAGDYDTEYGGTVKIGTPDGKPFQFPLNGQTFHVPPRGKRVTREVALRTLRDYGLNGTYYGVDQRTGMTPFSWDNMAPEKRAVFSGQTFNFITNYLVQLPDGNPSAEEETDTNG